VKKSKISGDEFRENLHTKREPGLIETITCHPHLIDVDGERQVLGLLQFTYNRTTLDGWIEMSNYGSKLQAWHLSFGGTSKELDRTQSGQHGDIRNEDMFAASRRNKLPDAQPWMRFDGLSAAD
jgi:hypothetical protein